MDKQLKILLLEDNISDAELLMRVLNKAELNHELHLVETKDHFMSELLSFKPDVVLSDHSLPNFNSMEALKISRAHKPDIPFILVTGSVSEQFAVDCMKAGVDDYILKNSLMRLPSSIKNILSKTYARREKEIVESLHAKLQIAYHDIENIHKNITDSINYAKLIQEAMLPEKDLLDNYFKNSFVLYKPKDIVSGDFYWFAERDNKFLIAVADCTGHGVPGALMSMIGIGLLNEIVNVNNITQPAKILNRLNMGIRKALKQDKDNPRYDGMDIALCMVDRLSREIQFAGANRHLVHFRGREMELVKGNKFGIGGLYFESEEEYTNHKISYDHGDIIYMFTDGYADQFGGSRGKRMMTRNLFKILHRSMSFGLEEQEKVLSYWLDRWQRNLEQTDDILLMGVQL
jgi:sigma-B regulation protein RsbU (phosphoserine phosphatase)